MNIWLMGKAFVNWILSFITGSGINLKYAKANTNKNSFNANQGTVNQISGDKNTITFCNSHGEHRDKVEAKRAYNAALVDLEYNAPGIGSVQSPFRIEGINEILSYSGPYKLSVEDNALFQKYLNDIGRCKGGSRSCQPGHIQNQRHHLKAILEIYIKHLNN